MGQALGRQQLSRTADVTRAFEKIGLLGGREVRDSTHAAFQVVLDIVKGRGKVDALQSLMIVVNSAMRGELGTDEILDTSKMLRGGTGSGA